MPADCRRRRRRACGLAADVERLFRFLPTQRHAGRLPRRTEREPLHDDGTSTRRESTSDSGDDQTVRDLKGSVTTVPCRPTIARTAISTLCRGERLERL